MVKESGTTGTPKFSFLILLLVLAVLIGVLLTIYFGWRDGLGGDSGSTAMSAQARLLLDAYDKLGKMDEYTIEYEEQSIGLPQKKIIMRNGSLRFVLIEDAVSKRSVYFDGWNEYVCINYSEIRKCARPNSSNLLLDFLSNQRNQFFDLVAAKERDKLGFLIKKGVLNFTNEIEEREYEGRSCKKLEYAIDYRKLSVEDLAILGMSATSPALTHFSNFSWVMCLGGDGIPIYYEMRYLPVGGQQRSSISVVKNFTKGVIEVAAPETLVDELEVEEMFLAVLKRLDNYIGCEKFVGHEEKDRCYYDRGIVNNDEKYCERIRSKDRKDKCYVALAGSSGGRAELCDFVSEMKDDCWGQVAIGSGKVDYCDRIVDSKLAQECRDYFKPECVVDMDCVVAGCSGQLCVRVGKNDTITTCEMRPEYACYSKFGGCGCVEGRCMWKGGVELESCIQDMKNAKRQ
ncbi:MAG: hypothetical protein QXN01_00340 [Candidatus Anstonellales archaeon]